MANYRNSYIVTLITDKEVKPKDGEKHIRHMLDDGMIDRKKEGDYADIKKVSVTSVGEK